MPRHSVAPIGCVSESPRCQLSNGACHILLASVSAEQYATIEMVFTGEFPLSLKTNISTPIYLLAPVRYVPGSPRCRLSNGASHVLLTSVSAKLQAAIEMISTSEFLLSSKTDISMPSHSLMPIRHVPESPQCQPSNGTSHVLLELVSAELQATMQMVFTSESLLTLKTDILTPSHSLTPVRCDVVQNSLNTSFQLAPPMSSHVLLETVSAELQAAMRMVFTGESLLTLKTDISTPSHSLTPAKHVPEFPRCQLSNGTFLVLLESLPVELQAAIQMAFTSEFLLTLKTDISTPSHSLRPVRHVPESP
ncbi:hypothetical protein L873DRAFT_1789397 [Choiromyces venosus 120613-1]|uniref:Uncharacterized protein n=1 Tax=Choiromyces venosus 120613-1 TaxID=1336337 RepID=A0A3N4JN93_9PEZI|nr:hypothetical protein L873DRAFT_1789397 [Choiromyces venosus 120613-1]